MKLSYFGKLLANELVTPEIGSFFGDGCSM